MQILSARLAVGGSTRFIYVNNRLEVRLRAPFTRLSRNCSQILRPLPNQMTPAMPTHSQERKFKAIEKEFKRLRIDTTQFGFYDQPAFLKQEERDSAFLNEYARWVSFRPRNPAYEERGALCRAQARPDRGDRLKADGSTRNCGGASGMLTPILNRLGVWSFGLAGSTILEMPSENITRSLYAYNRQDFPGAETGHVWVVAPPYAIVDATIALQPWTAAAIRAAVPNFLAIEDGMQKIDPTVDDIISDEAQPYFAHQLGVRPNPNLHNQVIPELRDFNQDFPAHLLHLGDLCVKYCPTAVRVSDEPLEEIMSSGFPRSAIQIWLQAVEPAFRDLLFRGAISFHTGGRDPASRSVRGGSRYSLQFLPACASAFTLSR